MKKTLTLLILLFLSGCGYSSIYSNNVNFNFSINEINLEGDQYVNNIIKKKLIRYKTNETDKKYKVKINSSFDKNVIAKNKSGNATDLNLVVNVIAKITNIKKDMTNSIYLSESFDIVKRQNNFEQLEYEKIIKKDLTQIILNKLIVELNK